MKHKFIIEEPIFNNKKTYSRVCSDDDLV